MLVSATAGILDVLLVEFVLLKCTQNRDDFMFQRVEKDEKIKNVMKSQYQHLSD